MVEHISRGRKVFNSNVYYILEHISGGRKGGYTWLYITMWYSAG